jgi:3-dehydroquinate synthase
MNGDLTVKSGQGDYPVHFFTKILEMCESGILEREDYFVFVDEKVMETYRNQLEFLSSYPTYTIKAVEESKTLQGVSDFSDWLISKGATKSSIILAIGGGIIQDVATFTAHIYKRGIAWHYIPTTLLSQSDSCIGAKCGINLMPNKNQLGVMHSPKKVLIVSEFLKSLEFSVFTSGYGEILKLSLTQPNQFYDFFKDTLKNEGIEFSSSLALTKLSLNAKKAVIEEDEYETDLRRILNYGHSFGHALESITHNEVDHGFAVLFGIDIMNSLSVKWGFLDRETKDDIRKTITSYFPLNILPRRVQASELIEVLKSDKKVSKGKMHFAILNAQRALEILPVEIDDKLQSEVAEYLDHDSIFTVT